MRRQQKTDLDAVERYAETVVRVLAEEFPDHLRTQGARDIVEDAVRRHALNPSESLEVILNPVTATWRLKPDREHPGRVRLAYYPLDPELRSEREPSRQRHARRNQVGGMTAYRRIPR